QHAAPEHGVATCSCTELFGPVTILYRARDFESAGPRERLAVRTHLGDPHPEACTGRCCSPRRGGRRRHLNGGTHGSEAHMGFGGVNQPGIGWREEGVDALDVDSDWEYVNLVADPKLT